MNEVDARSPGNGAKERMFRQAVVVVAATWGAALLCWSVLEWVQYSVFIGWLPYR